MPDFKPFIVSGLALGAIYSLSGVGIVLLYRASGVLNLAYGAIGAVGAFVAWQLMQDGNGEGLSILVAVAAATALCLAYGLLVAPLLAGREPVVQAAATLGYALVLLGFCLVNWGTEPRLLELSTTLEGFEVFDVHVNYTQVIALATGLVLTVATSIALRRSRVGVSMRALANDRELSALLGVRVRRTEAVAWALSGVIAGVSGVLLASLVRLDSNTLTFLVIASLAAAVLGRLRSLYAVFAGGLVIGVVEACATPVSSISSYSGMAPFLIAIVAMIGFDLSGRGVEGRSA
ncbi:MAG TPA: branched-chain amino acid ABC transporter permease [Solirubrobacterales bacterium]|jgi:branched-chain amino acid transport system permease protein